MQTLQRDSGSVASVLLGHEQVAEAAVLGAPSAELGEKVVAFLSGREAVSTDAMRALCASQLSAYKVPKGVGVWPEMPRTNVGKIDKQLLRASLT